MAKDKNKDKKAGGVKIPKKLRKIGKKAMKLADNPVVSEVVAAALLSAAAALRENEGVRRKAVKAGTVALDAAESMTKESGKVGDSLRKLALDLARKTLDSWDRADSPAAARAKPASSSAKPTGKPAKSGGRGGKGGRSGGGGKG
jgi:hypothetical protein